MEFNNTTNKNGLIQRCEFWINAGDGGISGNSTLLKQFTQMVNNWYQKVVTMILNSQDEWDWDDNNIGDYPIITTSMVANQQDYTMPASEKILKIKRVEVTYDGTNWYRAEPVDINQIGTATNSTTVNQNFSQTAPFYDVQYGSVFLYPIPTANSTNGIKMWVSREIDEFTSSDTTQEPGIDEPFHEMLALGASFDWATAKGLSNAGTLFSLLQDYEGRLTKYYGGKEQDREYRFQSAYTNYN